MMSLSLSDAREALQAAIARRQREQGNSDRIAPALMRINQSVETARTALVEADAAIEHKIVGRAETIRALLRDDGAGFDPNSAHIDLTAERSERARAQDNTDSLVVTQGLLVSEKAEAAKALTAETEKIKGLVEHVITIEADTIAQELIATRARASELHSLLMGLSYVPRSAGTGPWQISQTVQRALNWTEPQFAGHKNPMQSAIRAWVAYRDALELDPDASFDSFRKPASDPSAA